MPSARFDDLTAEGGLFRLEGYRGRITAHHVAEVAPAIEAAEAAARQGRWVAGFVSYEAAPGLDPTLAVRVTASAHAPPLAWFAVFDRRRPNPSPASAMSAPGGWVFDTDAATHHRRVERIRTHIEAGDTYQLNLTGRWHAHGPLDPAAIYQRLLAGQRPAFGALIDTGRWVIASGSPELFFEWRDGVVTCRPMKGTAPRGRGSDEDLEAGAALLASAKDRAENVMIVDLVRNDIGRVAEFGSVTVKGLFRLERYPTLWQLTSEVTGRTRAGTTLVDLFTALFPCGSVTGAPKHRTMELISQVEPHGRGIYCGAIGWVGPGRARFSVAIRTAVIDRATGAAVYGTGGGIVWDSIPEREYAEARAKAAVLTGSHSVPDLVPDRLTGAAFELVETMASLPDTGLRHRDRHLERMAGSASYFGLPFSRPAAIELLDRELAATGSPARIRLALSVSGLRVESLPWAPGRDHEPVRLAIDDDPVDPTDVALFHKTSRRGGYDERRRRHPDADDVVLVNTRGEVTETTIANLAVCQDGRWCTPPLDAGCLPGVYRAVLIDAGVLAVRPITVADLRQAGQVAVLSSLRGWRAAVIVPGRQDDGSSDRS